MGKQTFFLESPARKGKKGQRFPQRKPKNTLLNQAGAPGTRGVDPPGWPLLREANFLICSQPRKRRHLSRSGDSQAAESAPKTESGKPLRVNTGPSRQTRTVNKGTAPPKAREKGVDVEVRLTALCKLGREEIHFAQKKSLRGV